VSIVPAQSPTIAEEDRLDAMVGTVAVARRAKSKNASLKPFISLPPISKTSRDKSSVVLMVDVCNDIDPTV
jgi:hypothetical protein